MRITCLCEDTLYSDKYYSEHGLSLYIETNDTKILFDMGISDVFIKNAQLHGIDLSLTDIAVLSHGHYDHGGGMRNFMNINSKAKIYVSEYAFGNQFNATGKYIGLDKELESSEQIVKAGEYLRISDTIEIFSSNNRELFYPIDSAGLSAECDGVVAPDTFRHEQYLKITENGKTYLISGCSHRGIINIVNWFEPDILVGGFHFMKQEPTADNPMLCDAAEKLDSVRTEYYTCHCTGEEQYRILRSKMKKELNYIASGQVINI